MIPNVKVTPAGFELSATKIQPSKTYKINFDTGRIENLIDEDEAVRQTIYCVLRTERYMWEIYSRNHGIELSDLFGREKKFVMPQLSRRITDALIQDDRITGVYGFKFESIGHGAFTVDFTVETIYGNKIKITDRMVA